MTISELPFALTILTSTAYALFPCTMAFSAHIQKNCSNRTEFITCGLPWRRAQTSRPIGLRARVSLSLLVRVASLGVKISWNQYQYTRKALCKDNTEGTAYMYC
ncbi:hypothetical protein DER46DRAFT_617852 [Fusarium sp. MPI-SDFR-AT-0072]|nr:hypothetical protein DER46DRAFT_617852 [Fusarium sp. MPI-SDFR-AT-0072]